MTLLSSPGKHEAPTSFDAGQTTRGREYRYSQYSDVPYSTLLPVALEHTFSQAVYLVQVLYCTVQYCTW